MWVFRNPYEEPTYFDKVIINKLIYKSSTRSKKVITSNKNWRDVLRKTILQTMSTGLSLSAPLHNGPYKNKHLENHETRRTRHNRHSE